VAAEQVPTAGDESDLGPCASCSEHEHSGGAAAIDTEACERAAAIFRALGDPQRLRILVMLEDSERCVSELCQALQDNMPAISQRLRLLKAERIVRARRDGKHIYYALADNHIARLVTNGLLHALEQSVPRGQGANGSRAADED
jgi:ArsR family transcriptional regulator, lead/cadmium/zinc/bismuth-responsive transcriptional repressor